MDVENPIFHSLELIESRIFEKLTVANIAGAVYFSKYHYSRLFREVVGDSVMEYVTKRKLTLAGRKLLETGASVLDVALDYGYESREVFTRSFKTYMGVSPTEYRKYGLAAISQHIVKEKCSVQYSKTTDEIIREINDFIAKTKSLAEDVRKFESDDYVKFPNLKEYVDSIADETDSYADRAKTVLDRVASIARRPDEITGRFSILKALEDIAFDLNVMALHFYVNLVGRMDKEKKSYLPLAERYRELARSAGMKAGKVAEFLGELASLIIGDMRKGAEEKIRAVIKDGSAANEAIKDYAYYIKGELAVLVGKLASMPIEKVTVSMLEDCMFKLRIIMLAAKVDMMRRPDSKPMFEGMNVFRDSLADAIEFCQTIIGPDIAADSVATDSAAVDSTPDDSAPADTTAVAADAVADVADVAATDAAVGRSARKRLSDIAYQCNILRFYTKGEVEKMGALLETGGILDDVQKGAFKAIDKEIDETIRYAYAATDASVYRKTADMVLKIAADMDAEAEKLDKHGGAIKILAAEFRNLGEHVAGLVDNN
ncbi:MAG: helix-turn-helix transcriptional regulator [Oscillospiraceae bacterium]|nr:helix-turn-helix transcriptional regulator [Oscillospiraceae bacterium]